MKTNIILTHCGAGWSNYQAEISVLDPFREGNRFYEGERQKVVFRVDKTLLWNTPPDPVGSSRIQRKWCHDLQLRPSLPHAPGVRMTGVKQTPSNYISI